MNVEKRGTRALTSAVLNFCPKSKRSQHEMVGFALIVMIVAVILLVFLRFSLTKTDEEYVKSYEVWSFMQAMLQYTTEYESEPISMRKLIKECNNYDKGCDILEEELKSIMRESWAVEEGGVVKGYDLEIVEKDKEIMKIAEGVETTNYKYSEQELDKLDIKIKIYY